MITFALGIYSAIALALVVAAIIFLKGEKDWTVKDAALVFSTCIFWPALIILVIKESYGD